MPIVLGGVRRAIFEYTAKRLGRVCGADHKELSLFAWHLAEAVPLRLCVRGLPYRPLTA